MQRLKGAGRAPHVQLMARLPHGGLAAGDSPAQVGDSGAAAQLGCVTPCLSQRRMLVSMGPQNKAEQGWSSLQLFLHCPPPMMGSTSTFQQWVMLGTLHWASLITLQTRGAWLLLHGPGTGAAGGDWYEMGVPGEVPGTPAGSGWF